MGYRNAGFRVQVRGAGVGGGIVVEGSFVCGWGCLAFLQFREAFWGSRGGEAGFWGLVI